MGLVYFGPIHALRTHRTQKYGSLAVLCFEPNCAQAHKTLT